ncbi:MAG: hypothetical protein HY075_08600, partial [Deltaproteobacteria bacterium]|nr:hypothetical protein [Deltaproteobacteria bacterium]
MKKLVVTASLLLIACATAWFAAHSYAEREARRRVVAAVERSCRSCHLEIGSVVLSFLRGRAIFAGIRLRAGEARATEVAARVESVRVDVAPVSVLRGPLRVKEIVVERPDVTVREGDEKLSDRAISGA